MEGGSGDFDFLVPPRGDTTPASTSSQFVTSSRPPVAMQLGTVIVALGLSAKQLTEIIILAHEGKKLET